MENKKAVLGIALIIMLAGPLMAADPVPGKSFNAKMSWLTINARSGGDYAVEIPANGNVGSVTFSYGGKNNITITLTGEGGRPVTLNFNSANSRVTVGSGVTLILDNNISLQKKNSDALITVNSGGVLILNSGRISGRLGVQVKPNGTFTMEGGVIGGQVNVDEGGTFVMNGGEISGFSGQSGGVVTAGDFAMSGGKISRNIAVGGGGEKGNGGGVSMTGGTFTMSGGEISNNSSTGNGGGVYIENGTFTMSGGEISNNSASGFGGGVYGGFVMEDGKISGNSASFGGGVHGGIAMSGGEISGNTASNVGGGVFVDGARGRSFTKTGGTIYGYSNRDRNSNSVKNSSGAVQPNKGHAVYAHHSSSVNLIKKDATSGPSDNLSYDREADPPAEGRWEWDQ
jgi:hypothetical protein